MASTPFVGFALFDDTGAPLPGAAPTFATFVSDSGVPITPPAINDIGGGLYVFQPTFNAGQGTAYVIDGGVSAAPRYQFGFLRPEDMVITEVAVWDALRADHITAGSMGEYLTIGMQVAQGRIEVDGVAGTLTVFQADNTTPLFTRNLRLANDSTPAGLDATIRRGPGE